MKKSNTPYACALDKHIFKEIEYLLHSQNSEKAQDTKAVIQWIEHFTYYLDNSYFTPVTMAHFFDVINSISDNHPQIKIALECFFVENPTITQSIIEKSYDLLFSAKIRELTRILSGVILSKNFIVSKQWMERWFECSKNHLSSANALDLKKITYILLKSSQKPDKNWIQCWEIQCELYIFDFHQDPTTFWLTLAFINRFLSQKNIHLSFVLSQNVIIYLKEYAQSKDIFLMSRCFQSEEINQNKNFLNEWFNLTENVIQKKPEQYLNYICFSFLFVQKLQNPAPENWIDLCIKTFINYFDNLTTKDIIKCLYALALMQKRPEDILPFLDRCKEKIPTEINGYLQKNNLFVYKKYCVLAQNYFYQKGFNLEINIKELNSFLKTNQDKNDIHYTETTILAFLNQFKDIDVIQEYWIPEIADTVDFAIQTKNGLKIVEFDGPYHEVNGTINRLTQLKTYLLQSYGYDLLRIHHRDTMNIGSILKEYLNLIGDHQYVFYRQNQTVESTIS